MTSDWAFAEPAEPTFAYLVIYDTNGLGGAWLDGDQAHEFARNTNSVVVKLPVTADFRTGGTD
jgi:hypothetical protein